MSDPKKKAKTKVKLKLKKDWQWGNTLYKKGTDINSIEDISASEISMLRKKAMI